ncbi:MAG: ABC transporter permease [Ruminococcus sp.]|nr:ABC transporter permease [Ruminococcus sp.]
MHRIKAFTIRNIKELSRDPLSYIFCLGFPIIMLIVMTLVNESIPAESGITIFRIDNLAGGIAIFGQTFTMLFTALNVSKDRNNSFLVRIYASPMKPADFVCGYILPMLIISIVQTFISFSVSFIISLINDVHINISGLLMTLITLIPSAVMFISLGLLFGTILSEKSAPGLCAVIISLGSFFGGIWFDAESTGGIMLKICKALPFYYCTKNARSSIALSFELDEFISPLIITTVYGTAIAVISSIAFKSKMKADLS